MAPIIAALAAYLRLSTLDNPSARHKENKPDVIY
jgi:hypothetical protein